MTDQELTIQAHRYLYYVMARPMISDRDYDELEKQLPSDSSVRESVGSDRAADYMPEVIRLAQKLLTQ